MELEAGVQQIEGTRCKKTIKVHLLEFWEQRDLQLMVVPWILFIVIFCYVPMYGVILAFQNYNMGDLPGVSQWVGVKHFVLFFQSTEFPIIMRNTFAISILKLLICFPVPIILAILLNEVRRMSFKRTIQTISYLPHFVSWVVVAGLTFDFLSIDGGVVNSLLQYLGLIKEPIVFMGEPGYFWGITVLTDLWKELGWNAIIYIAAIASINPELYEAAEIDGAGRFNKIWNITLVGIKPTIIILLILAISNLLNAGFEQILILTNNLNNSSVQDVSEIIETYVYRVGIRDLRYSYATAAGLFKSVFCIVLLTAANYTAKKLGEESLW